MMRVLCVLLTILMTACATAQSEKKSAVWDSPQGEQSLAITSQEGRPMQDQYPVQRYDHSNMTLSLSGPEAITDGTRYKTGTLSTITGEGWEKIIPVHGLSACKRASNALSG